MDSGSSSNRVPLLLVPNEDRENHWHSLYDVTTSSFLELKVVVPFDKRFAGSSNGWLVGVDEDSSVTLYKPHYAVSGKETSQPNATTIRLPPVELSSRRLECFQSKADYHVSKALITADPLENPNECIVVVNLGFDSKIAVIRPGRDKEWTFCCDGLCFVEEVVYWNEKFYAIGTPGQLLAFNVTETVTGILEMDVEFVVREPPCEVVGNRYLVESQGKLFLVERFMCWGVVGEEVDGMGVLTDRKTRDVIVYELKLKNQKQNWVEINDLGDVALFIGDSGSISVKASSFPGCKSNCIYFTHDTDGVFSTRRVVCDFGVYDLRNQSMEWGFGMDDISLAKISKRIPIWFTPCET